jgi:membrane associated rhomboid family serine protease
VIILPYSTDAPVYHWPYATVGIIVANALAFWLMIFLPLEAAKFVLSWTILTYGNFNPITWVTSNYVHGGPMHLIGNMFALWAFGLIVEGKIGWWKFLALYHGIGFVQCGFEQTLTLLFSEGGSFGASAIIYGLMAIALVWAPANNMHCWYVAFGAGTFEATVYFFVGCMFILQLFGAVMNATFGQSSIGSEVLHLMGALVGAAVGIVLLKQKLVDCEDWDAFSLYQGKHLRTRDEIEAEYLQSAESQEKIQSARDNLLQQIRTYSANGETMAAWAAYKRGLNQFPGFKLEENDLLGIIAGLRKAGLWDETITLMVTFLRTFPQRDGAVRLALAQLLMEKKQRGLQAYKVLQKVDKSKLDPRQQPLLDRFAVQARAMADDDPYEVAPEDW